MEEKIMVVGEGINQEIVCDSLFDCIDTAYRNYKGKRVELLWIKPIGYIDGDDLFIEDGYLDRHAAKEIIQERHHDR